MPFAELLFGEKIFSKQNKERVLTKEGPIEQARLFLDILLGKPEPGVEKFFELLRTHPDLQPQLYSKLFPEYREHLAARRHPQASGHSSYSGSFVVHERGTPDPQWNANFETFRAILPMLRLSSVMDRLRMNHLINQTEHNKLTKLKTEQERKSVLLNKILPSRGSEWLSKVLKVLYGVDGQRSVRDVNLTEIPRSRTRTRTSPGAQGQHQLQATRKHLGRRRTTGLTCNMRTLQMGGKRKFGLMCRAHTPKKQLRIAFLAKQKRYQFGRLIQAQTIAGIQEEPAVETTYSGESLSVALFFKKEYKLDVERKRDVICTYCYMMYKIEESMITFWFLDTDHLPPRKIQGVGMRPRYCVFIDTDLILFSLTVTGVEQAEVLNMQKCLNEIIAGVIGKSSQSIGQEVFSTNSALVVLQMDINTCFLVLDACCTHRTKLGLAIQEALPGLKKVVLRLGSLPPYEMWNASTFSLNQARSQSLSGMRVVCQFYMLSLSY